MGNPVTWLRGRLRGVTAWWYTGNWPEDTGDSREAISKVDPDGADPALRLLHEAFLLRAFGDDSAASEAARWHQWETGAELFLRRVFGLTEDLHANDAGNS